MCGYLLFGGTVALRGGLQLRPRAAPCGGGGRTRADALRLADALSRAVGRQVRRRLRTCWHQGRLLSRIYLRSARRGLCDGLLHPSAAPADYLAAPVFRMCGKRLQNDLTVPAIRVPSRTSGSASAGGGERTNFDRSVDPAGGGRRCALCRSGERHEPFPPSRRTGCSTGRGPDAAGARGGRVNSTQK